jgi:molybdopterin converting factor small subunit
VGLVPPNRLGSAGAERRTETAAVAADPLRRLDGLYERYDGLRERIAEDGDLRRFVNVYVGGEDIRFLDGLDTGVEDGDEVTILPAVAGGA